MNDGDLRWKAQQPNISPSRHTHTRNGKTSSSLRPRLECNGRRSEQYKRGIVLSVSSADRVQLGSLGFVVVRHVFLLRRCPYKSPVLEHPIWLIYLISHHRSNRSVPCSCMNWSIHVHTFILHIALWILITVLSCSNPARINKRGSADYRAAAASAATEPECYHRLPVKWPISKQNHSQIGATRFVNKYTQAGRQ